MPLVGAAPVERAQQRTDEQHQEGHADQHQQTQRDRGGEQDRGHQQERHDGAGEPGGDVHDLAEVGDVVGADRDDLTGRDLPRERAAEMDRLPADQLHGAVGRRQPVGDREPVPHDAGERLDDADAEHQRGEGDQGRTVLGSHSAVDGGADHRGHHRLAAHPDDAEAHPADKGAPLAARQPEQEGARRAVGGRPGVVEREAAHSLKGTDATFRERIDFETARSAPSKLGSAPSPSISSQTPGPSKLGPGLGLPDRVGAIPRRRRSR